MLLINPRSGKSSPTADELAAEARAIGLQTHVLREGEDPAELARAPGSEPSERVSERFVVDAAAGRLEAAVDGEPDVLETPVEFRVEPRALRVLVPPGESG